MVARLVRFDWATSLGGPRWATLFVCKLGSERVSNRIVGKISGTMLIGGGLFLIGTASAAQLGFSWMDNADGICQFLVATCLEATAEGRSNLI